MYYPYFRGKQYELITIRETADILNQSGFIPIIEPVKESFSGLIKTLNGVKNLGGKVIVIVNPDHGYYQDDGGAIVNLLNKKFQDYNDISFGVLLKKDISQNEIDKLLSLNEDRISSFIHAGFTEAKSLVDNLGDRINNFRHIFLENKSGKLYQRHFQSKSKILLRDGFEIRTNRDHPEKEFFSDLHATFKDEGMSGFGDFLIVGDEFSETGGPAYAVAIHLTYIDDSKDGEMHIHHFKSIRQNDPKDPAGKFAEALRKLTNEVQQPNTHVIRSNAAEEFLDLHSRGHFPGLGYVKKLSMKHHIETLADYFNNKK